MSCTACTKIQFHTLSVFCFVHFVWTFSFFLECESSSSLQITLIMNSKYRGFIFLDTFLSQKLISFSRNVKYCLSLIWTFLCCPPLKMLPTQISIYYHFKQKFNSLTFLCQSNHVTGDSLASANFIQQFVGIFEYNQMLQASHCLCSPTSESPQGLLFTAVLLAAVQVDFLPCICPVPCISLYVLVFNFMFLYIVSISFHRCLAGCSPGRFPCIVLYCMYLPFPLYFILCSCIL